MADRRAVEDGLTRREALLGGASLLLPRASRAARPGPRVARVENGGLLFTDNPAGVSGVDCGYSVPIGRLTLWLFGDVFLLDPTAPARPYVGGVSNCALVVSAGEGAAPLRHYRFLTDPKTGLARQALPNRPTEDNHIRLWPQAAWYDAPTRRVYTWYGYVRTTGGGPLDFRTEGHGVAVADATDPARLRFDRLPARDGGDLWWRPADGATFGMGVVAGSREPGGYVYVVGMMEGDKQRRARLARVPAVRIANPAAYEYLTSADPHPQWGSSPRDVAPVEGLADFPGELSVAWNPYVGGYLAVHSVGLSDRIRLTVAPHPWGPYRAMGEIGAPRRAFSHAFCYAGKEHPELREHGGRTLYVTYVDSERYWLQLLKVTLDGA